MTGVTNLLRAIPVLLLPKRGGQARRNPTKRELDVWWAMSPVVPHATSPCPVCPPCPHAPCSLSRQQLLTGDVPNPSRPTVFWERLKFRGAFSIKNMLEFVMVLFSSQAIQIFGFQLLDLLT